MFSVQNIHNALFYSFYLVLENCTNLVKNHSKMFKAKSTHAVALSSKQCLQGDQHLFLRVCDCF